MAADLRNIIKIDLSYPGISFGYESWALDVYLNILEDHLSFAQEQYRIRAERELNLEGESLGPEEMDINRRLIDVAVETHIPRFFRNGALVQIWGLFESFVTDIARYSGNREKARLSLRDIQANNFRQRTEKYFAGVLRINLPWSAEEWKELQLLQELRNFIAHSNGRVTDLAPDKRKEIHKLVSKLPGVEIEESLMVSADYIKRAAALVFHMLGELNKLVSTRYDGPSPIFK
ncbi:MAG TPA: hypothetical protein VGL10_04995 [Gammaproteobacteria bacterium]